MSSTTTTTATTNNTTTECDGAAAIPPTDSVDVVDADDAGGACEPGLLLHVVGGAYEPDLLLLPLPPPPPISSGHWNSLSVEIPPQSTTPDQPCNCKKTTTHVNDVAQPSNYRMRSTPIQFTNVWCKSTREYMRDVHPVKSVGSAGLPAWRTRRNPR